MEMNMTRKQFLTPEQYAARQRKQDKDSAERQRAKDRKVARTLGEQHEPLNSRADLDALFKTKETPQ